MMGATLANGGVNPLTRKQAMPAKHVPELLAVMATAGFYDESGDWMYTAGLPAKTGVGGGIVAVVPGRFAIAAVSLVQATSEQDRWNKVQQNLSDFAGSPLTVLEKVYESEYSTAWGNRGIANLLYNWGRLYSDPEEALRVYTRQCSVGVSARDLGMMGATLANGGVNPLTRKQVMPAKHVPELLAVMATAGFYDESGDWMYTAGLPAKTGVGGGIVAVVPGRFAIAAFSPRLNEAGNSVRSLKAIRDIAGELGVGVFGPNPN
jgi:glutaminase